MNVVQVMKKVERTVVEEVPTGSVQLTLCQQEIDDLMDVVGAIGGLVRGTVRETTDNIHAELCQYATFNRAYARRTGGLYVTWSKYPGQ